MDTENPTAMRRLCLFVTAIVVLFAAGAKAHAQTSFRVSGGVGIPTAPSLFADASAPGAAIAIGPVFTLTDQLNFSVSVAHSRFPTAGTSTLDADAMTAWSLTSDLLFHLLPPSSSIRPYATVGGGMYRLNHTPERVVDYCPLNRSRCPRYVANSGGPEMRLGLQVGVGASVSITPRLRAFVQPTYTFLVTQNDNIRYLPLRAGIILPL